MESNKHQSATLVSSPSEQKQERRRSTTPPTSKEDHMMKNEVSSSQGYTIVKRNGTIVPFRRERIAMALEAAFRDTKKIAQSEPLPADLSKTIQHITDLVMDEALKKASSGAVLTVEGIQDIVEIKLMETGDHDVAKDYIIYRDKHKVLRQDSPRQLKVLRRDGITFVRFNPMKVAHAIERGFRDTLKIEGPTPENITEAVNALAASVVDFAMQTAKNGTVLSIEMIQDEIERLLMAEGYYRVAKDYILYRAVRTTERNRQYEEEAPEESIEKEEIYHEEKDGHAFTVVTKDGSSYTLTKNQLKKKITFACRGQEPLVSADEIVEQSITNFYDGIKDHEVDLANILAARSKVEFK